MTSCIVVSTTVKAQPEFIEELIPADVRTRWGIKTRTPLDLSRKGVGSRSRLQGSYLSRKHLSSEGCSHCKAIVGLIRTHPAGILCPVAASLRCSGCSCYGHTTDSCDVITHVTRPTYLEELIPPDLVELYGINTLTPIDYPSASEITLEDAEREIGEGCIIEIRHGSLSDGSIVKLDAALRTFMKAQRPKLETVHKMEGNLIKLRLWAVAQGKKIRLVQEG